MTVVGNTKHVLNFTIDPFIDTRNAVRLFNSACNWFQYCTEKTTLVFGKYRLNTEALSKKLLKPLDQQIGFINGIRGIMTLDKCVQHWREAHYFSFGRHLTKTFADNLGGLKYFASIHAFIFLTPYLRELTVAKALFGVTSALFGIALRINDIAVVEEIRRNGQQDQVNGVKGRITQDVLMVGVHTCACALNTFTLSNAFVKSYKVSALFFDIAGTAASVLGMGYTYMKYNASTPNQH